jgi:translation initiation factor 1 (eIF-1/SUI1)
MSKILDSIKAALQIAFSLVVLAIVLLNFRGLHLAIQKFLERAASVSAIKAFGVEIDMDATDRALSAANAKRALFKVESLTDAEKRRVLTLIHGLDRKEFIRLMYVGQLKNLCEFENPSTEMRSYVALDYEMRDKGLTKIEINPATLESVRAELAKKVAQGKTLDNGYPRTCYDMTLTDDGYNVKTVLVKTLSGTFDEGQKAPP